MSTYTTVGNCPKCGAPIYAPTIWHGILPPPNQYTCGCYPQPKTITTTNTGGDDLSRTQNPQRKNSAHN
jgi:hypothetical protein